MSNPLNSPLGKFPELAAMYQNNFQAPVLNAQVNAQSSHDQTLLANQKASADAESQKQQYLSDPSNYQQVARPDGGYGFYDASGKEISAQDYAAATGKSVPDVLRNSQNPIDIGFQKDYKDLQDYINLKLQSSTDKGAATKASAIEADVSKTYGINIAKLTPDQLIKAFQAAYPTVYGGHNTGVPVGQTLIPQATDSFVQNSGSGAGNFQL